MRSIRLIGLTSGFLVVSGFVWWIMATRYTAKTEAETQVAASHEQALAPAANSSVDGPLVFDQAEVDLGPVKGTLHHRFTYVNKGDAPITIKDVSASCACLLTKSDKEILGPQEAGFVTFETDITKKTPGGHRFSPTIAYETPQPRTARAYLKASYQLATAGLFLFALGLNSLARSGRVAQTAGSAACDSSSPDRR